MRHWTQIRLEGQQCWIISFKFPWNLTQCCRISCFQTVFFTLCFMLIIHPYEPTTWPATSVAEWTYFRRKLQQSFINISNVDTINIIFPSSLSKPAFSRPFPVPIDLGLSHLSGESDRKSCTRNQSGSALIKAKRPSGGRFITHQTGQKSSTGSLNLL